MNAKIIKAEVLAGILDDLAATKPNAETCRMFLARAANSLRDLLALLGDELVDAEIIIDLFCACCENATHPADLADGLCPTCVKFSCGVHPDSQPDPETGRIPYTRGTGPRQLADERPSLAADDFLFAPLGDEELSIVMASLRSGSEKQHVVWPRLCEAWWETKDLLSDAHKSFMLRRQPAESRPPEWVCGRCQHRFPGAKPGDGICLGCADSAPDRHPNREMVVLVADPMMVGEVVSRSAEFVRVAWAGDFSSVTDERQGDVVPFTPEGSVVPWTPPPPEQRRLSVVQS